MEHRSDRVIPPAIDGTGRAHYTVGLVLFVIVMVDRAAEQHQQRKQRPDHAIEKLIALHRQSHYDPVFIGSIAEYA